MQEQQQKKKEQEQVEGILKAGLLKYNRTRAGNPSELELNSREFLINAKKLPDAVYKKYLELINRERKQPSGHLEQ